MAHPPETIQAVRTAFVFDQLSLEVAAIKGGVSPDTARRWKREAKTAGDDWDKARAAQLLSGGGIEEVMRQSVLALAKQAQATLVYRCGADCYWMRTAFSLKGFRDVAVGAGKAAMPIMHRAVRFALAGHQG